MRAGAGRNGGLGQTVNKAIQDVLGWKLKPGDPTGFIGALNQSFQLKTVEGAVVSTWNSAQLRRAVGPFWWDHRGAGLDL